MTCHDFFNADALDEEPWDFTEAQMDTLAVVLNELRKEWQRDHAVEIAELRGEVRALLAIVGKNTGGSSPPKDADVIDLPAGFIRRRNDAA